MYLVIKKKLLLKNIFKILQIFCTSYKLLSCFFCVVYVFLTKKIWMTGLFVSKLYLVKN